MENRNTKIEELFNKAEWTNAERRWLLDYFEHSKGEELHNLLKQHFEREMNNSQQFDSELTDRMLQNIHEKIGVVEKINKPFVFRMWSLRIAAACIFGLLLLATYAILKTDTPKETIQAQATPAPSKKIELPPGNKALLTLADGSTIVLDDKQDGFLADQGNTKVLKLDGKLVYNSTNVNPTEVTYNTITTPTGGQYQIELPDGSLVWLNASSSLRFPTAFIGKERRVEISGEAYFEVAKNVAMPFTVKVKDAEVQVLGTKFNIMAYDDEAAMKTTLLHGQVKFVHGSYNSILKPGQQTQLAKNGIAKLVSGIDVDEVIAWKNGMFDFEGADLVTVARQLSRWYDVEMIFDKKNDDLFYAKIPRDTRLKDVLKALELTGKVRFIMQGRKITVKALN